MKKIMAVFVVALGMLMAQGVSAATYNLTLAKESGTGSVLISPSSTVVAAGGIAGNGSVTDVYSISSSPESRATGFTIGTPEKDVTISEFALYSDSLLSNLLVAGSLTGTGNERSLTYILSDSVKYFLKIVASNSRSSISSYTLNVTASAVPVPGAVWLLGSALMGLVGVSRRKVSANGLAA